LQEGVPEILAKQGYTLSSIPENGAYVKLHLVRNLSQMALMSDVTTKMHESFQHILVDLANQLGLYIAGFDLFAEDITKDSSTQKWSILEINHAAGYRNHHFPQLGSGRNVCRAILGDLFPELTKDPIYWTKGGPAPHPKISGS